jgi:hypothetical protein
LVAQRVVIPVSVPSTPGYTADPSAPHSPYPAASGPVGQPSSTCQQASNGSVPVLNGDVGSDHVWVYGWQESGNKVHLCVRDEAADTGFRVTIKTDGGADAVQTYFTNLPGCTFQIIDDNGPPPFSIYTSPPGTTPVSGCAKVGTSYLSVVVNPSGSQNVVSIQQDN